MSSTRQVVVGDRGIEGDYATRTMSTFTLPPSHHLSEHVSYDPRGFATAPLGDHLAVASDTGVHILDRLTLRIKTTLGSGEASAVAISINNKYLAIGVPFGVVRLLVNFPFTVIAEGKKHTAWITALRFSHTSDLLASGSSDKSIVLWSVPAMLPTRVLKGSDVITDALFLSRTHIASAMGVYVRVWGVETGSIVKDIQAHDRGVNTLTLAPNGRVFASGGADWTTINIISAMTFESIRVIKCGRSCLSLAFIDNNTVVAAITNAEMVSVNITTGDVTGTHGTFTCPEAISVFPRITPCTYMLLASPP